jgi:hypothetical protein
MFEFHKPVNCAAGRSGRLLPEALGWLHLCDAPIEAQRTRMPTKDQKQPPTANASLRFSIG